jgi:ATP-dependent helicase/nuclease subunit A
LWPGVHANLEALLELALNVDAGRYPSLTRFVDELRRLSSSDDEAPDEGLVAASAEDGHSSSGRVRIMTIHGAKGLEAPIVWLIDANAVPRSAEGYGVAMDWPVDATMPQHFSLLGRLGEAGPSRAAILEREKAAAEREELNLLYVAITRAEQVLVVSGIEPARTQSALTPYKRIAAAVELRPELAGGLPEASRLPVMAQAARVVVPVHAPRQVPCVGIRRRSAQREDIVESAAGAEFGLALHAWLEAECAGWPHPQVEPVIEQAARRILERPGLQRFFDPAKYVRAANESSFVMPDGKLGRIDRWVEMTDAIWILDYKSGNAGDAPLAQYREQVDAYRRVLQGFAQGKPVRGLLIFAGGTDIELE